MPTTDSRLRILHGTSEIDPQRWQSLTARSPVASFFQSLEAHTFFSSCGGMQSEAYGVEQDGQLAGVMVVTLYAEGGLLRRRFTSRAIVNGGPLLDGAIGHEALLLLLNAVADSLRRRCIYLETRNFNDYSPWRDTFLQAGFSYQPHYNFHIVTDDKTDGRMDKGRRRKIRRAVEHGVRVEHDNSAVASFHTLLLDLYRTKIHKPLSPLAFFETLVRQPFTHLFVVREPGGNVIGGQLCVELEGKVLYSWYCCGQDNLYHDLHPSIMANYAAIRYAADNGFLRLDMMGAGSPGDGGYGVRDFKAQFGGTLVEHGRYLRVFNRAVYSLGKLYIKLKSKA